MIATLVLETVLAIDPGSEQSAWVMYAGGESPVQSHRKEPNLELLARLRELDPTGLVVVIETMSPRGKPTSLQEMETMFWAGRFAEASDARGAQVERLTRDEVKRRVLGRRNGNDSHVIAALTDRFGGIGGRRAAVGVKAAPGPLYGVAGDVWQALALAIAWRDEAPA